MGLIILQKRLNIASHRAVLSEEHIKLDKSTELKI